MLAHPIQIRGWVALLLLGRASDRIGGMSEFSEGLGPVLGREGNGSFRQIRRRAKALGGLVSYYQGLRTGKKAMCADSGSGSASADHRPQGAEIAPGGTCLGLVASVAPWGKRTRCRNQGDGVQLQTALMKEAV